MVPLHDLLHFVRETSASISPLLAIALVATLCILCQLAAWRFRVPSIVLLSMTGLVLGPGLGILNPRAALGNHLQTLVSIAVAIILFDGGLGLRFQELKEMRRAVTQLVLIGAPLGWVITTLSCHEIAGLSWPVSLVFGGILVVTGPTVILPLLRQANLQPRAAAVLKWEGIINDPLGALFAVVAFEYFALQNGQYATGTFLLILFFKICLVVTGGFLTGKAMENVFLRGWIPEFLKQPVVLITVVLTYAVANEIQEEAGLIAVTMLGITLANSKLPNLDEMRRFKEYLTLLLVSLVFVLITATLVPEDIARLGWRDLAFVLTLLLIVRPITVLSSSVGAGMSREELLFIGWVAPRGVVCAAVSGLFGPKLLALGYTDAGRLVPMAFCIVFVTVIGHGFTINPWGRRLGLVNEQVGGVLFLGSNPFTIELATRLKEQEIGVLIADPNWYRLRHARQAQIPFYYGDILSENAEFNLQLSCFSMLVAATDNSHYNMLVAWRFAHEFGYENLYQLAVEPPHDDETKMPASFRDVTPILGGMLYDEVMQRISQGWKIKALRISKEYPYSAYREKQPDGYQPLLSLMPSGPVMYAGDEVKMPESGYTLLAFTLPAEKEAAA